MSRKFFGFPLGDAKALNELGSIRKWQGSCAALLRKYEP